MPDCFELSPHYEQENIDCSQCLCHNDINCIYKRVYMVLNYKPLWIQLEKRSLKKTDVIAIDRFNNQCDGTNRQG